MASSTCPLLTDDELRHFRSARWRIRAGFTDIGRDEARCFEDAASNVFAKQRLPLPASLLWDAIPPGIRAGHRETDFLATLSKSARFRQSSPGMFVLSQEPDDTDGEPPHGQMDATAGATLARLATDSPPIEGGAQRRAFKRLAGLRLASSFADRAAALVGLDETIEELGQRVLLREGWTLAEAHSAAMGPDLVIGRAVSDTDRQERARLLTAVHAEELLAASDPADLNELASRLRSDLTVANLRLVLSLAEDRAHGGFMRLTDIFQEGAIGLMRAIDGFDPFRGFAFSTYATWWIRQAMTRAIADQSRLIRLPVHMVEQVNRVERVSRDLLYSLGREPTVDEVAAALSDDPAQPASPEKVRETRLASREPLSLSHLMEVDDDGDGVPDVHDWLADAWAEQPSNVAIQHALSSTLDRVLGSITARERRVLVLRFGLDDGQTHTLEEVGRELGCTRERVRQIESKALRKLTHHSRLSVLAPFR